MEDGRPTFAVDSVLPAWNRFLAHNHGKPIVLVRDSADAT
jgi:hypothetical protein